MSNDNKDQTSKPTEPVKRPAKEDGLLDSIGKAISDPVKTGAEEEETERDNGSTGAGRK